MLSIWEMALDQTGERITRIYMPEKAKVMQTLWRQGTKQVFIYVWVNEDDPMVERRFQLIETREQFDGTRYSDYIGSVQSPDGQHVYHILELNQAAQAPAADAAGAARG